MAKVKEYYSGRLPQGAISIHDRFHYLVEAYAYCPVEKELGRIEELGWVLGFTPEQVHKMVGLVPVI